MKKLLHTDTELMRLSIPFSQEEMNKLETSIIENGCLEPIIAWQGLILDGHKRYKICVDEDIDFEIKEMDFCDLKKAAIWVCSNRIAQYDKRSAPYIYLIGKWYDYQKSVDFEQRKRIGSYRNFQSDGISDIKGQTSIRLGEKIGINRSTVEKYSKVTESIERLDMIEPMLSKAILSGEVHFSQNEIIKMMQMDNKTISRIRHKYVDGSDIRMRAYGQRKRKRMKADTKDRSNKEIILTTGIKEMPKFDPDMSLRGLTLTIPMWISAIEKAQQQTDMTIASEDAKMQLGEMLIKLDDKIQNALEVL